MSRFVDVPALAQREGLEVLETLKEGYDHDVYLVERDGMRLVLKTIVRPELRPNLHREIAYATLLATLADSEPGWTVRTSVPRAYGDGWLLRDHVPGAPLLAEDDLGAPEPLRRVARALADLDRVAPDPNGLRPRYRDAAGEPRCDESHRMSELQRWVETVDAAGALPGRPDDVLATLAAGRRDVLPGLEVWDVKLDDFRDLPDGRVGVFDLEFAHLYGRRHYDAAVLFGKLAIVFGAAEAAACLLGEYVGASTQARDDLTASASPVLAETLLSQLYDAVDSDDAGRVERAAPLLARCLDGGLPALLAAEGRQVSAGSREAAVTVADPRTRSPRSASGA